MIKSLLSTYLKAYNLTRCTSCHLECKSTSSEIKNLTKEVNTFINRLLDEPTSRQVSLALDECIRNAYEHGNLELNSLDKSTYLNKEILEHELSARELKYGNRNISLEIKYSKQEITFIVADEGNGFDWRNHNFEASAESLHGRGIKIIRSSFDKVIFNEKGNICTMIKTLN